MGDSLWFTARFGEHAGHPAELLGRVNSEIAVETSIISSIPVPYALSSILLYALNIPHNDIRNFSQAHVSSGFTAALARACRRGSEGPGLYH